MGLCGLCFFVRASVFIEFAGTFRRLYGTILRCICGGRLVFLLRIRLGCFLWTGRNALGHILQCSLLILHSFLLLQSFSLLPLLELLLILFTLFICRFLRSRFQALHGVRTGGFDDVCESEFLLLLRLFTFFSLRFPALLTFELFALLTLGVGCWSGAELRWGSGRWGRGWRRSGAFLQCG